MSDKTEDNPFADVADMAAEPASENSSEVNSQQVPVQPTDDTQTKSSGVVDSMSRAETRSVEKSVPSFDWSDTVQTPIYILEDTELDIDDFKHNVSGVLRREYGVRNAEKREIDEAIICAVLNEFTAEQIAQLLIRKRGYNP